MKKNKVRLEGIYDKKTFTLARAKGVKDFVFDLRPRSFNFIQGHVLEDILRENFTGKENIYLKFQREKDFVVKKCLSDLLAFIPKKNIFLEFSDRQDINYYEKFSMPFVLEFEDLEHLLEIQKSSYCVGLVADVDFLTDLLRKKELGLFFKQPQVDEKTRRIEVFIKNRWNEEINKGIIDNFRTETTTFSYSISPEVEISYRKVNLDKIKNYLTLSEDPT